MHLFVNVENILYSLKRPSLSNRGGDDDDDAIRIRRQNVEIKFLTIASTIYFRTNCCITKQNSLSLSLSLSLSRLYLFETPFLIFGFLPNHLFCHLQFVLVDAESDSNRISSLEKVEFQAAASFILSYVGLAVLQLTIMLFD